MNWKEINPRAGVSYDLFGNGKTAIKASIARGVAQESLATADALNPAVSLITSTARTVTDSNNNHMPDCNLFNSQLNGECGPWLTSTFGSVVPGTQNDPATLSRLRRAAVELGVLDRHSAAADAARLGRVRLLPPGQRRLPRHRQRREHGVRLHVVPGHRAGRQPHPDSRARR